MEIICPKCKEQFENEAVDDYIRFLRRQLRMLTGKRHPRPQPIYQYYIVK